MDNVILCNGKYAKIPYEIEAEGLHLYSIEELCYYMFTNAWVLEESFLTDELLDWIDTELELPELSEKLKNAREDENPLLSFLEVLFAGTGYYDDDKIRHIRLILQGQTGLSIWEKRKKRADLLLQNKRYNRAQEEYENLLKDTRDVDIRLQAKLYHNLGVCATKQFLFARAARFFKRAYELYANTESYVQFLCALKLSMENGAYLSYLAKNPESYEDSLEVENRIKRVMEDYDTTDAKQMVENLYTTTQDKAFYENLDLLVQQYKDEYRTMIL